MNVRERINYLLQKYEARQTNIDDFAEVYT